MSETVPFVLTEKYRDILTTLTMEPANRWVTKEEFCSHFPDIPKEEALEILQLLVENEYIIVGGDDTVEFYTAGHNPDTCEYEDLVIAIGPESLKELKSYLDDAMKYHEPQEWTGGPKYVEKLVQFLDKLQSDTTHIASTKYAVEVLVVPKKENFTRTEWSYLMDIMSLVRSPDEATDYRVSFFDLRTRMCACEGEILPKQ